MAANYKITPCNDLRQRARGQSFSDFVNLLSYLSREITFRL